MMTVRTVKNPIIPGLGVCDPHIHIFRNRAYLYASHDAKEGSHFYDMYDWQIWSSDDLVNWTMESTVRPEDFCMGPSFSCWAVDAAEKNDKYYLYVSNGMDETYVLISDDPGKGFREPLGRPLLPAGISPTRSYDPAVFTDDDGAAYIVFGTPVWAGGDSYYIARLNDDMISLAEEPRKIRLDNPADDKPFIHKHNGMYYLSWASFYAVSDSICGPYKTMGNLGMSQDHASFFPWNEQWFMAFTVDETIKKCSRAAGICYVHFMDDGRMRADQIIREYGVGQYDGRLNCIEAEWYTRGYHVDKKENIFDNFDVIMKPGSWIEFPNIHHLPDGAYLIVNAANDEDTELDVYEGSEYLGTLHKPQSFQNGGDFSRYGIASVRLPVQGPNHSIRLVSKGNIRLNWFHFMA